MPHVEPPVLLLLLQREGAPQQRHTAAWQEALAQDSVAADITHVWAGEGPVPAGMDLGSLGACTSVLGVSDDTVAVVAEATAQPGPHVVRRLVDAVLATPAQVVDARVLPLELTRTDQRPRGYGLADGADPGAEVLEEVRRAWAAGDTPADPTPRATGVCCALRVVDLPALDRAVHAAPDQESDDLAAAAAAAHLTVVVATDAVVSLPVRVDWDVEVAGRVVFPPERAEQWASSTHPADLPATSVGALASRLGLRPTEPSGDDAQADGPFLSIVTRTQGRRLSCLEDVLTCLAGQSDRDFELLLMCHRTTPEERAAVEQVVASAPEWLRERVETHLVERAGRAAPLNDGFVAARGRYVVALDDDDTVLAHYVASFKAAAVQHDGRLLRAVAVRQDVVPLGDGGDVRAISVDDPYREWPLDFSLVDHLSDNYSPIMTVAIPRGAVQDLGLRFDETLPTNEDWEFIVRCAALVGVASVREITSVYRWWLRTASSREAHSLGEWDDARSRVLAAIEESVVLFQPEEVRRLVATLTRSRSEVVAAHELAEQTATALHEANLEMAEVRQAHRASVAKRRTVEARLADVKDTLETTRLRAQRATRDLQRAELVHEVQERIRNGTLEGPEKPLTDMTIDRLKRLAESPVTRVRRPWWGRR
ncbi:glycosyltransferase [Nocardia sp. N13]|uniref:glycosyltransferase n=1 Tax=Nocardioides sp. N13(2025) TaxID=3453405 RepID=UPI003F761A62